VTRLSLTLAILAIAVFLSLGWAGAAVASASPPSVESESVSNLSPTGATLEAEINPQGASAGVFYQFQLLLDPGEAPTEIACPSPPPPGYSGCEGPQDPTALPLEWIPGDQTQTVSLDLSSAGVTLTPGQTYYFRVLVADRIFTEDTAVWEPPAIVGPSEEFTTPTAPSIESESVSNITSTDATLEALINPGGLETTYEFRLETLSCWEANPAATCDFAGEGELGGTMPAGSSTQAVSVDIAQAWHDLSPHTRYIYSVHAINSAGDASGSLKEFETLDASAPSIESESVSNITSTDATLEAQINPNGAAAGDYYQFQLVIDPSDYASEILCPTQPPRIADFCIGTHSEGALPIGFIPGNSANPEANSPVSLDLASAGVTLQPGRTYHYRVLVARRVLTEDTIEWESPTVYGDDQMFTTSSESPSASSQASDTHGPFSMSTTIQSSPSALSPPHRRHVHHRRHRRARHRIKLDRASQAG
jgi:hypothetical protein